MTLLTRSLSDLQAMPTLAVAQADSLKIQTPTHRVWLSRCGVADGLSYDNEVTVEVLINGRWVIDHTYEGKD